MSYQIRPASASDWAAVEHVTLSAYQPWVEILGGRPGPMDEDFASLITDGGVHVAVANQVAGVIMLANEADTLLIKSVAVAPEHQSRGLGRQLMAFAETAAGQAGLAAVRLFTHERMESNIAWYLDLGYAITGTEPVAFGRLVHMRKSLHPVS